MKSLRKVSIRFLLPLFVGVGLVSGFHQLKQRIDWQYSINYPIII